MFKLAANLDWLYRDLPIEARFAAARQDRFHGVEGLFLWQHPLETLCRLQRDTQLPVVLMNAPAGNWAQGERGLAAQPDRDCDFWHGLQQAAAYARALGCRQIHVMSGPRLSEIPFAEQYALVLQRLQSACDYLAQWQITLLIEPLNAEDMPDYFISTFPLAAQLIADVGRENIALQFDIYHCQKIHGNIINNIHRYKKITNHFQIASVPGRHQPGTGELNDALILNTIKKIAWHGWIGCEYTLSTDPHHENWLAPYL